MKKYFTIILTSFLVGFVVYAFQPATLYIETWEGFKRVAVYNEQTAKELFKQGYKLDEGLLGTSITTINATDTLRDSRTTINDNFTALNAGKIEISTTTLPLLTTLANLSTVGTITSGVWSGTVITVAKGGTGLATLSQYQVLLGSSTNAVSFVNGLGSDGQFLTSQGAGLPPVWESSSVDQAANYTWTGLHIFNTLGLISNASSTFNATTTIAANSVTNNALVLNGQAYKWPTTQTASSSLLMTNGSGTLLWNAASSTINNVCVSGQGSRAIDFTGTENITHNLGVIPTFIEISAFASEATNQANYSVGMSNAATSTQTWTNMLPHSTSGAVAQGTGNIIKIPGINYPKSAKLWSLDYNTFTLNWDVNGNNGNTVYYQFKVCK